MGITFEEVRDNNLLSIGALKLLNDKCKCGSDYEFDESLKRIKCTNENCIESIICKCCNMLDYLKIAYNKDSIKRVVNKYELVTPFQLLIIDQSEYDINLKECIENRKFYLYELVNMLSISELSNVAYDLFYGFNSLDELYHELNTNKLYFINERLGIPNDDSSILSLRIYKIMLAIKEELYFGFYNLNINQYSNRYNIAFDNKAEPYMNKKEFMECMENITNITFNHVMDINENTDILIKNENSISERSKYANIINNKNIARKINDKLLDINSVGLDDSTSIKPVGTVILICTTLQLKKILKIKGITVD